MVVTTSSASKGLPSLKVTPWRSLNVQTSSVSFGVQLSASLGISPFWLSRSTRNSRNWVTSTMPPWS